MKSFAIYYRNSPNGEGAEQTKVLPVEIHMNIWKVRRGKVGSFFELSIDFGIKFPPSINGISLFIPFRIKNNQVEDLGERLFEPKLLSAVFNEELSSQLSPNQCFAKVVNSNDENKYFFIYKIDNSNIEKEPFEEGNQQIGTIVKIKIKGNPQGSDQQIPDDHDYYIRFRVMAEDRKDVVKTDHLSNDLLQAAFSMSDLYDIRLNEKREIPDKVHESLTDEKYRLGVFNKVHVFYIVDSHEDVFNRSVVENDCRVLENNLWEKYEPQSDTVGTNYIAYHWKKTPKEHEKSFKQLSLFFTTRYPHMSKLRLFAYLSVVTLLGWLGSTLTFNDLNSSCQIFKLSVVGILFIYIIGFIFLSRYTIQWFKIIRKS